MSSITLSTASSELHFSDGGRSAPLTVRISPTAKVMRLRVDPRTGTVLLTMPRRASRRRALEWAAGQRGWIEARLAQIPPPARIVPGEAIPYRGLPHLIDWSAARPRTIRVEQGRIIAGGPAEAVEARLLRWLRAEALRLLTEETREYADKAGVPVGRVGVGDPVSRWGSCSSTGTIRYSWRLILAPDHVRRATVAHEVAHRVHMNHGPQFHALVKQLFGADPAPAREWLRREGAGLHLYG